MAKEAKPTLAGHLLKRRKEIPEKIKQQIKELESAQRALRKHKEKLKENAEEPTHSRRLLEKKMEATDMQKQVTQQIEDFKTAQDVLSKCKEKLKEKEQQMHHLIQSSIFLKQSEDRRCDAERKAAYNSEMFQKKQEYLEELREELSTLIELRHTLKKQIELNCIYAEYLDEVVEESKEFHEPEELITHFETRKKVQDELLSYIEEKEVEMAKSRAKLVNAMEEYALAQINHETKMDLLKGELKETKEHVLNLEAMWNDVQKAARIKNHELARINMAMLNMSKHLWNLGSTVPKLINPEETIEVLDKVQEFICDLKLIWEKMGKTDSEKDYHYTGQRSNSKAKLQRKKKTK
ncbi:coiled-coil domain-containing protein 42 homolog [Clarias gariepinus]